MLSEERLSAICVPELALQQQAKFGVNSLAWLMKRSATLNGGLVMIHCGS